MKRYKNTIILLNLVLLFAYFVWSVAQKENTLKNGQLVLLELAPVDPRSLMQGDYMNLRYGIASAGNDIYEKGYFVLRTDERHVGIFLRMQTENRPVNEGETIVKYESWGNKIGAESYFFEEGSAEKFEKAKYGGLMVDKHGNTILTGLYDENCKRIE